MNELLESICYEKQWREKELAHLSKLTFTEKNNESFTFLYKYYVLIVYSIFEGYVKEVLKLYSEYINRQDTFDWNDDLLTHIMEGKGVFNKKVEGFENKKKHLEKVKDILNDPFMPEERPYASTLKYKDYENLLKKFGLTPIDKKYASKLTTFAVSRNAIAHGENHKVISETDILDYIELVTYLMDQLEISISDKVS